MALTNTSTSPTLAAGPDAGNYELVVGMEVHAQVLTRSKMFCGCATDYAGAPPNTRVCPVCLGMPGVLPVINRAAIEATIKTGLALNCEVPDLAIFARKNYNYPDLPKGYQITQYEFPQCQHGWLDVELEDGSTKRIRIRRVHLEEDTGRSVHEGYYSLIDLNRAGTPLMEIVTEADIHSAEEAYAYLTKLRSILRYLGVNSGDMEKGALRCEPNISVRTLAQKARDEYGTKVEVKNLKDIVGGVSPNSQVSPELGTVAPQLWRQQSKPPLLVQTRVASCITSKYFVSKLADNIFVF